MGHCFFHFICTILKIGIGLAVAYFIYNYLKKETRKKKEISRDSVVVISNGTSAIGSELALLLAQTHQCKIVLFDTDADRAKNILQGIQDLGSPATFYECDWKDKNSIMIALAQTIAKFSQVDIFINTGGFSLDKSFEDYCYEELSAVMESNFLGPAILIKELLSIMKEQPAGHIVNVPAAMEVFNSEDVFTYCGTRGALGKLIQGLQAEMKRKDSTVKISIARPVLIVDRATEEVDLQKVRRYANKIHEGILYELEEI